MEHQQVRFTVMGLWYGSPHSELVPSCVLLLYGSYLCYRSDVTVVNCVGSSPGPNEHYHM